MLNRLTFKRAATHSSIGGAQEDAENCPGHLSVSAVPSSRKAFASERPSEAEHSPSVKRSGRHPRFLLVDQGMVAHFIVDACEVTDLRRRVIAACGDRMLYMRIQPLHHASEMRVWMLLQKRDFDLVSRAIKADMPQVELAIAA